MYLLFDIGGTRMRLTASLDRQTILPPKILPTPAEFDPAVAIGQIKDTAINLSRGLLIESVGGGIAGVLDKTKSQLVAAPHLKSWVEKPLKQMLQQVFSCPVFLENDAAMAGLGEATVGAGVGKKIVAFITIGTGVGGARIVDGRIDHNCFGFEPGHQIITFEGNVCPGCNSSGHLEAYVSGSAIEMLYQKRAEDITDPKVWEGVARWLAVGLNNTIIHWSPDIVILGGGMMNKISIERVNFYLNEALAIFPQLPDLVLAKLGEEAGLYGSLEYLKRINNQEGLNDVGSLV